MIIDFSNIKSLLLRLYSVRSLETLNKLRKKFKLRFIINTTIKAGRTVYEKFTKMEFNVKEDKIFYAP